jgi:hypothetical protein
MLHESQTNQKREGLVVRKPDLNASSRRIHAVESEIRALQIGGAPAAAKTPIGLQKALQPGTRLRTRLCRILENAGDGPLDLIALEHKQTLLQVSIQAVNVAEKSVRNETRSRPGERCTDR